MDIRRADEDTLGEEEGGVGFKMMVGLKSGEQLDLINPARLLLSGVLARGTTDGKSLNL